MSDIPTVSGPDYPMGDGPTTLPVIKGYKIIKQLGEGGMGIVYLAEQTEPIRRQVALKVVKPGMDSREVIARFQAERQALAMLDHPNVAHVYDAGTTENGRPYFVMEYIDGIPITDYCDRQELSIEDRLELFQQVCEGIQHAHQRGIIHRDLKPSNILVISEDGKATPKVIDFGIAKAIKQELTQQTLFTAQGQLIGTPEYMSPEQANLTSLNIDTRTDVYSLGVILYQLLTGALPFDPKTLRSAAFGEIQRIIREVDPPRPSIKLSSLGAEGQEIAKTRKIALSTLTKKLHKELEWIPLKAMRKESGHRYQSVSEFSKDIENYLNGSPLLAGPESKVYRIKKYVRRNRVLVASSLVILIVLFLGILVSTYFGFRERESRIAADQAKIVAEQKQIEAENAKKQETKQRQIAQEKAELNRQQLYFMSIKRAAAECERKNIIDALELLENCSEDLRGWEWFYLWKKTGNSQLIYSGGNSIVDSVAFSPDGKMVAWGKEGIIVWDTEKNIQVMNIGSHGLWMDPSEMMYAERSYRFLTKQSVVFSPDGKWLAVGNGDEIKVWEIETGKEILSIICKQVGVSSVAFSYNGKYIVSGGKNGTIKIWDAGNGTETKTLSGGSNSIYSIAFSPDGTRIVSGEQFGGIKIWDSEKGDIIVTFLGHTYPAEIANSSFREFGIESTAFSPDGKQIVSGDTILGTIKVWDAIKGTEVMTLSDCSTKNILNKKQKRSYATNSVCFSSDGKSIISAISDGTIRIWDAQSGEETSVIYGHRGGVASVAFSPDGKRIVSGGAKDGKVRLQNIKKEPETFSFKGHKYGIESICFSHDGSCIVSGSRDGTVNIWSSKNYSLLKKIPPRQIEIRPNTYTNAQVLSVAFSPNDEAIAIGDEDGVIRIINPENSTEILNLVGDKSGINSVAFSPDGKRIISGEGSMSNSGTVRIYDIDTGNTFLSFSGSKYGVSSVAVSQNGKWLASSWNIIEVKLWNLETLTEDMTMEGHNSQVNCIVFNPEGTKIAVAHRDGIITVWDTKNVTELTFNGFQGNIKSLAFSPDGKRLISVGELGTIKIWDTKTFSEALTIEGQEAEVNCVAFSPDGTMIVSGDSDGVIKIWGTEGSKETLKIQTINSAISDQDLKLITACKMGKIGAVRDTITNGAEVDSRDEYGCTPLQWAADKGYPEIVSFLVGKGADIEAKDDQGKTALMWGAGSGQSIIVQFLLEKRANIDAKDTMWGKTALMWAADKGHIKVVKILLDKGADINTKDFSGKTALIRAKSKKYFDIVKILQEKDAIE